jgi:hypothetical protein
VNGEHVARFPRIRAEYHPARGDLVDEVPSTDQDNIGARAKLDHPADVRAHGAGAQHANLERHVHRKRASRSEITAVNS